MRLKVMCVDDEPMVLSALCLQLRRDFDVLTVSNPQTALQILKDFPYVDVVIADLRMPKMDGASFLAGVHGVAPNAIRFLLTGDREGARIAAALTQGSPVRFLRKPVSAEVLRRGVEEAIEARRSVSPMLELRSDPPAAGT